MKDFIGYLMVQTDDLNDIVSSDIINFYNFHREKNNECSLLSIESCEQLIPTGKIIRNIANRIIKISETEELNDEGNSVEIKAGLFCFNTKKIIECIKKYSSESRGTGSLTGMIEFLGKSGSKINSFPVSSNPKRKIITKNFSSSNPLAAHTDKISALLIPPPDDQIKTLLSIYEAVSIPQIERTGIIVESGSAERVKDLLGDSPQIMQTDDDLGNGYDAIKAYDWLKNSGGNVVTISGQNENITKTSVKKLIDRHTVRGNTCTTIISSGEPVMYCAKTDYFIYAVKRIVKDDDTKKYYLSQITDILKNDNKQVEVISIEDIIN